MVWQFWGRAAEDVLSLGAQGVFFVVLNNSPKKQDFLKLS